MTELELLTVLQDSAAQITQIISHIITINFAMIVAVYYFLNKAGWRLKTAAFALYTAGMVLYFMLAVRQSVITTSIGEALAERPEGQLGPVMSALIAFRDSPTALVMNISLNLSIYALWFGVLYLLYFWKLKAKD